MWPSAMGVVAQQCHFSNAKNILPCDPCAQASGLERGIISADPPSQTSLISDSGLSNVP